MDSGLTLIEPTELYNILNQSTVYSNLSDPNYLLLLDARPKEDYNESHVITAKKAPMLPSGEFELPYEAELGCKLHVVVYDSNTRYLSDGSGDAIKYGNLLWRNGSRNSVKILRGGYEDFSAFYPFLRTQTIIQMPRELDALDPYPMEILPGLLYLGNKKQAHEKQTQKHLKFKAHVNCTMQNGEIFTDEGDQLCHIPIEDTNDADIFSKLQTVCEFIDSHKDQMHTVLVYSDQGISRSATVVVAYVMHHYKWSLQEAYEHTYKCCLNMRPLRAFIHQLSQWEEYLHQEKLTDVSDPNF